jgi:hypothetical protein
MRKVGSVQLINQHGGKFITVPDFWKPQYSALWTQLQNHLASVYDSNPLIRVIPQAPLTSKAYWEFEQRYRVIHSQRPVDR